MNRFSRRLVLGAGLAGMTSIRRTRAADAPSGDLVLMAYSGSFQDNYMKAVVEPFMKANPGVNVIYNPGGSSAQMLGMLRAQRAHPQIDVIIMDFSVSRVANKEGLFRKFTPEQVPNMADVYDQAKMPGDMGPGITFDNLVMVYNPQAVKPAPTGIPDLLNPAHKGRIVFPPAPNVIGIALQLVVAHYLGADYKGSSDPEIKVLEQIAQNVQTWNPMPDSYTMVINGDADIGIGWNARAQAYKDKAPGKIESITMQQGSILDMDTVNLVEGARNPAAGLAFINYALSAEAQERFAKLMYYGPSNRTAKLAPEVMARTSSYPDTLAKMIPVDWDYVAGVQDQWTNRWRREVVPAR
ncbi:MAG TPA: ABC transporter substrate-binding protein [Acetobacteraceae bacterium]|nr:ABC transporter substrate-binding protein [Acetobacteraceae bacterium]